MEIFSQSKIDSKVDEKKGREASIEKLHGVAKSKVLRPHSGSSLRALAAAALVGIGGGITSGDAEAQQYQYSQSIYSNSSTQQGAYGAPNQNGQRMVFNAHMRNGKVLRVVVRTPSFGGIPPQTGLPNGQYPQNGQYGQSGQYPQNPQYGQSGQYPQNGPSGYPGVGGSAPMPPGMMQNPGMPPIRLTPQIDPQAVALLQSLNFTISGNPMAIYNISNPSIRVSIGPATTQLRITKSVTSDVVLIDLVYIANGRPMVQKIVIGKDPQGNVLPRIIANQPAN